MSEQALEQPTNEAGPESNQAASDQESAFKGIKSFDDIPQRRSFGPDELALCDEYLQHVASLMPEGMASVNVNDYHDTLPAGWSIMIAALQEQASQEDGTKYRKTVAVVVWPFPSVEIIGTTDAGMAWLNSQNESACASTIMRAIRGKSGDALAEAAREIPFDVDGFTTAKTREGIYKVYNALAGAYLTQLRKSYPNSQVFKNLTPKMLRDAFESTAYAMGIGDGTLETRGQFVALLNNMRTHAEQAGQSTQCFDDWLRTRDDTTFAEFNEDEVDFAGLTVEIKLDS